MGSAPTPQPPSASSLQQRGAGSFWGPEKTQGVGTEKLLSSLWLFGDWCVSPSPSFICFYFILFGNITVWKVRFTLCHRISSPFFFPSGHVICFSEISWCLEEARHHKSFLFLASARG